MTGQRLNPALAVDNPHLTVPNPRLPEGGRIDRIVDPVCTMANEAALGHRVPSLDGVAFIRLVSAAA
jgi:hypothetical protein